MGALGSGVGWGAYALVMGVFGAFVLGLVAVDLLWDFVERHCGSCRRLREWVTGGSDEDEDF